VKARGAENEKRPQLPGGRESWDQSGLALLFGRGGKPVGDANVPMANQKSGPKGDLHLERDARLPTNGLPYL